MTSHRMRYKIGLTEYNVAIKDIDQLGGGDSLPVGTILSYIGSVLPSGFLWCDGSALSRAMYPDLFSVIGTTYGSGDGETTFNLPNLTDGRFLEGGLSAGTSKDAGLPNIEGTVGSGGGASPDNTGVFRDVSGFTRYAGYDVSESALYPDTTQVANYAINSKGSAVSSSNPVYGVYKLDASRSSAIYGNSNTVQPKSLTVRFIIKAFDSVTSASSLIDLTQYASDLSHRLTREQTPAFNQRVEIRTSGNFVAPVTGWYKFTIKGAGGGGGGFVYTGDSYGGPGGGEGGTTFVYEKMTAGDTATVTIGAGGSSGEYATSVSATSCGGKGGDTSVSINNKQYIGYGGNGGGTGGGSTITYFTGGAGGAGTVYGDPGGTGNHTWSTKGSPGGHGGGAGGGYTFYGVNGYYVAGGIDGSGGAGGSGSNYSSDAKTSCTGGSGGNGYVFIEYFDPTL